jgi:hypothetical protein
MGSNPVGRANLFNDLDNSTNFGIAPVVYESNPTEASGDVVQQLLGHVSRYAGLCRLRRAGPAMVMNGEARNPEATPVEVRLRFRPTVANGGSVPNGVSVPDP